MEGKKILIIEDDEFLQSLAAGKLQEEGFDVALATNTEEAMRHVQEGDIDLILLDLVLPGDDGFAFLEQVRTDDAGKNMPVIVFSNLAEEKDVSRAKDLGADQFMVKSNFTLDELVDNITKKLST